jgi:hypothetical protein
MLVRARTLTVAAMACTALSACSGVVPVKNVETDKLGYLAKSFSLPSVPSAVVGPIRAADDGTLPFQRMTFSMQPVFENISGGNAPPAFHSTWTLINIGGPFVQSWTSKRVTGSRPARTTASRTVISSWSEGRLCS